jgi:hypothetical protein
MAFRERPDALRAGMLEYWVYSNIFSKSQVTEQ